MVMFIAPLRSFSDPAAAAAGRGPARYSPPAPAAAAGLRWRLRPEPPGPGRARDQWDAEAAEDGQHHSKKARKSPPPSGIAAPRAGAPGFLHLLKAPGIRELHAPALSPEPDRRPPRPPSQHRAPVH